MSCINENTIKMHNRYYKLTISGVSCGHFRKVPVVISLHFKVEYFTFWITSFRDKVFVK